MGFYEQGPLSFAGGGGNGVKRGKWTWFQGGEGLNLARGTEKSTGSTGRPSRLWAWMARSGGALAASLIAWRGGWRPTQTCTKTAIFRPRGARVLDFFVLACMAAALKAPGLTPHRGFLLGLTR